jgi:hypothetical protein
LVQVLLAKMDQERNITPQGSLPLGAGQVGFPEFSPPSQIVGETSPDCGFVTPHGSGNSDVAGLVPRHTLNNRFVDLLFRASHVSFLCVRKIHR